MSVKCRRWVLKSHFSGMPKREDLDLVEEELPPLKDGGYLLLFNLIIFFNKAIIIEACDKIISAPTPDNCVIVP